MSLNVKVRNTILLTISSASIIKSYNDINTLRKISLIFLLKLPYKTSCVKINAFSSINDQFIFPLKGEAQKRI